MKPLPLYKVSRLPVQSMSESNRLLDAMLPDDVDLLRPDLQVVSLALRQVIEAPFAPVDRVYFITSGLASVVAAAPPDHRIEVAMIGREGMTGLAVVLGTGQGRTR